ncbi:peptide-aspartate beta-dioxygenase [Aureococcus anophagefferens]|uniref:Peptide-aspartate beta-dioxygenase n=1 Tax=Aureococcus anophagefferens TaxID=44056 RepID=A0ABR1G5U4_AURAN
MGATLLSPFAQQINDELEKRFGAAETARVREAWRLMDVDYVHKEALIEGHEYMKQEARSYLPGLTPMPFWDLTTTAWAQELEANWEVVRDEFRAVAMDDADNLKKKGNNVWVAAADSDSAASYGPDWRTLVLMDRTTWDPTNCNLFPKTAKLLSDAGVPCVEAFFASMTPNSKIAPHTDSCNFVLTSHLGLDIPPDCHITVGDETRYWKDGQVTMFDTSSSTSSTCPTSSATTPSPSSPAEAELAGLRTPTGSAPLAPGAAKPKKNKKGGKKKKKGKAAGFGVAQVGGTSRL